MKAKARECKVSSLKKSFVTAILVVSVLAMFTAVAGATTHYVNPGDSINSAVNTSNPGDTIIVRDGTYNEFVVVDKRLKIRSENGSDSTTVAGCFRVEEDYVNIRGFTVTGWGIILQSVYHCNISSNNAGIRLYGSDKNDLTGNTANSTEYGIYLEHSSNNMLTNNIATSNWDYGICLSDSSNYNTLMNNTANSNDKYGIELASSSNNMLTNNTANSNVNGIYLSYSSNNTLTSNTASNNGDGIYLGHSSNNTLSNNTANKNNRDGIRLYDSSNYNTLSNNTASNNDCGIFLSGSSNNTLSNNTASNNDYGIYLGISSNNTLTNNTANENTDYGIYLYYSSNYNTLTNNTANSNNRDGIRLYGSSNYNTLTNNTANSNTWYGIYLDSSSNNTLTNNTANLNDEDGIYLKHKSNYNTLTNNTANSNTEYGIFLYSSSNYNTLTNNTANSNVRGIFLSGSSNNTLTNNTASNNYGGIYLDSSTYNTLTNNTANSNDGDGIYLDSSSHNTLTNNTANENNEYGIFLWGSSRNTLTNNTANSNHRGINVVQSSNYNTFTNNTANSNTEYGIYLYSSSNNTLTNSTASNNALYDFYSDQNSHDNNIKDFLISSYPTTISFTYDNGIKVKGVTTPPKPDPAGKVNIGKYVNVTNVTANSWIFLNVSYKEGDLGGVGEDSLRMWRYNGTDWMEVPAPNGVNTIENYVYANITEFSVFAPLGNPSGGLPCTCGDICVNTTGWWLPGGQFNPSSTPIQDAIGNATAGDTICVKDGTYNENVNVYKQLTIRSENGFASTIVNASVNTSHVFEVTADYVNISGFTVQNATANSKAGIYLNGREYCNIYNNTVTNNHYGIYLQSSSHNTLSNNNISLNIGFWAALLVWGESHYNDINNNTVCSNNDNGIYVGMSNCSHNTIKDNYVSESGGEGVGIFLDHNVSYSAVINNTGESNKVGIQLNDGCDYNNISSNRAYNNTDIGIALICMFAGEKGNSNNSLSNNIASNNTNYDFYSDNLSHNNTVKDLTISSYPTTISFTYGQGIGIKGVTTPEPDPAGKVNISKYVNATNVTADSWIFLNVSCEDVDLGSIDENSLRMWKYNGTDWTEVPGTNGVNTDENYVYANITEFSVFAPLGVTQTMGIRQEFEWNDTSGTFQTVSISTIGYVHDIIANMTEILQRGASDEPHGSHTITKVGENPLDYRYWNCSQSRWLTLPNVNRYEGQNSRVEGVIDRYDRYYYDNCSGENRVAHYTPRINISLANGWNISVFAHYSVCGHEICFIAPDGNISYLYGDPHLLQAHGTQQQELSAVGYYVFDLDGNHILNASCMKSRAGFSLITNITITGPNNYTITIGRNSEVKVSGGTSASDVIPPHIHFNTYPLESTSNNYAFISINASEPLNSALLEWNGINETMQGSGRDWYINKTNLGSTYIYKVYGNDSNGNWGVTEEKQVEIGALAPPNITSFAPPSPVNDTICNWSTFSVTVNQTINVSWYLNDSFLFTNESVTEANCTLHAEVVGEHNVSAIASNSNGTDMQTWVWNVTSAVVVGPPNITALSPVEAEVSDTEGAYRTFSVTVNQTVNVRWLINGTQVRFIDSVTEDSYTNVSAAVGYWNVSAIVENENGRDMHTWWWNVTKAPSPCYIATATYGTPLDENINVLRDFRDEVLMTNPVGEAFVSTYYGTSPPIADALRENDGLRTITGLTLITPLVYLSKIALNGILFVFIIGLAVVPLYLRKDRKRILKPLLVGTGAILVFTAAIFSLGFVGYTIPICAVVGAYMLPFVIPLSVVFTLCTVLKLHMNVRHNIKTHAQNSKM